MIRPGDFPVCFGRDDDGLVFVCQHGDDAFIGVERLVGDEQIGGHARQKLIGANQVMGVAAARGECRWLAQSIHEGMNFGAQSAAGSPDGLVAAGFFFRARAVLNQSRGRQRMAIICS
jgi:hypothetical protein